MNQLSLNLKSGVQFDAIIEEKIWRELVLGCMVGPFDSPLFII